MDSSFKAFLDKFENKRLFVAIPAEVNFANVKIPVTYTGIGKVNTAVAFLKWFASTAPAAERANTLLVNIGTAGSTKYKIGDIVPVNSFFNGGAPFVHETVSFDIPGVSAKCMSSDFFVSTETFPEDEVKRLQAENDFFDMESFVIAKMCKELSIPFVSIKIVSDNLDGTPNDWDETVDKLRPILENFINQNL